MTIDQIKRKYAIQRVLKIIKPMAETSYLPLNRKVFRHEFWEEERVYSRFEAWIDLLRSARFESAETCQLIKGQPVKYKRGELIASLRFLTERWGWGKTKVETFIKYLIAEQMITKRTPKGTTQTVLTICNYASYNLLTGRKEEQKGQSEDSRRTVGGQSEDKTNKENKENKENYARDADFESSVLRFFGFNEISHYPQMKGLSEFCKVQTNLDQYEYFKQQFLAYSEFKKLTGLQLRHNFNNYLGKQENRFEDGQWNAENWSEKLKIEKAKGINVNGQKVIDQSSNKNLFR